jgi:hypothetical protein
MAVKSTKTKQATPAKVGKAVVSGYNGKDPIRIATSNLFIETEIVAIETMAGAIFNDIGGQELINDIPFDILYGSSDRITNISSVVAQVDPLEIMNSQDTSQSALNQYVLNIQDYMDFNPGIPYLEPGLGVVIPGINLIEGISLEVKSYNQGTINGII